MYLLHQYNVKQRFSIIFYFIEFLYKSETGTAQKILCGACFQIQKINPRSFLLPRNRCNGKCDSRDR